MRHLATLLLAGMLAACGGDPTAQQAAVDTRFDPVRADSLMAVQFQGGANQIDYAQSQVLRAMVEQGTRARRDEFVVVIDGSGGPFQQSRADVVRQALNASGARWISSAVEPNMAMGPNTVVIVRSEYRVATHNCPDYGSGSMSNWNETVSPGFGCANAYNFGQMLARPRDAAVGRDGGPADATVMAAAVQRYREGRVKELIINGTTSGVVGGSSSGAGVGAGAGIPMGGGSSPSAGAGP